jgi:hypothetical protein
VAITIAGRAPAGASFPLRLSGTERVAGAKCSLGFLSRPCGVVLTQPKTALDRRIESDGQEQAASANAGKMGHGPPFAGLQNGERAVANAAQGSHTYGRPWATERPRAKSYFHSYFFTDYSFYLFLFIFLSKSHTVFSTQIVPTKNLFRKYKSNRIFSKMFKIYEFYSFFRCK